MPLPRRFLVLSAIAAGVFAVLAASIGPDSFISYVDSELVTALHAERPSVVDFFTVVTDLGAGRPLWVVGTVAVLVVAVRRDWFRILVWTAGLLLASRVTPFLKAEFRRVRPPYVHLDDFSFPSGHAFGSAATYGMLALAVLFTFRAYRWRWIVAGVLWAWIGLIALSRPILGYHYPSDVVAGASLGLAWGFAWAALADWWDLRRTRSSA